LLLPPCRRALPWVSMIRPAATSAQARHEQEAADDFRTDKWSLLSGLN
jgi:hypothetical protein